MNVRNTVFFALITLFVPSSAHSLPIPEHPQAYVNDYANVLSPESRLEIEGILSQFEKETTNQLVVAIFNSLENESLEDYSIHLAEKWKVGTKDRDNGIILLIFMKERSVRIEVGYGLEGALSDATASEIIRREIAPAFREGRYDQGVLNAIQAIIQATKGEYKAPQDSQNTRSALILCLLLVAFFFAIIPWIFSRRFGRSIRGTRRSYWTSRPRIWTGGGFGGGSFGGFSGGGGSFGGGGASGRW